MIASGTVAGALFLGSMAIFIGAVVPHMPPIEASAVERAGFYAQLATSPTYAIIRLLIFAQLAPLALFLGGLLPLLRRAEGGSGALANAVVAAAVFSAVLAPMAELVEGHLLLGLSSAGADPVVAAGFDGMTPVAMCLSAIPQLVVLAGAGLLLGAARLTPGWLNWLGYVTAGIGLLSLGVVLSQDMVMLGILSAILYKLWMVALSVTLVRRAAAAPQPAPRQLAV